MNNILTTIDCEYDFVAIVDCLPQNEREAHGLSKDLHDHLENLGFGRLLLKCNSASHLLTAFKRLHREASKGQKFIFHLICHGSAKGIYIKETRERIEWSRLRGLFAAINQKMNGNLVANLSSCFGLHGIKSIDLNDPQQPFFGIIGPSDKITFANAKKANREFYKLLGKGSSINAAIPATNGALGSPVILGITDAGYRIVGSSKTRGAGA